VSISDAGDCKKIEDALKRALDTFEAPAVRVLLYTSLKNTTYALSRRARPWKR
jgi:hypothetical protein